MGVTERKKAIRQGDKLLATAASGYNVEALKDIAQQLSALAQEVVDDFDYQRGNFGDAQGLLDNWEENYGYQSEEWESQTQELEELATTDDLNDKPEELYDAIVEAWETASEQ
jgi:hypothetical protein